VTLDTLESASEITSTNSGKVRLQGGGRKKNTLKDNTLKDVLEALIEPVTRGDPESPLRRTCKSTGTLEPGLKSQGHAVGRTVIGELLKEPGYSLQPDSKLPEGNQHTDRNEQFEYINNLAAEFMDKGLPVISVDTKKKELTGNYKNAGKEYRPQKDPRKAEGHDFGTERAVSYGVYDTGGNTCI